MVRTHSNLPIPLLLPIIKQRRSLRTTYCSPNQSEFRCAGGEDEANDPAGTLSGNEYVNDVQGPNLDDVGASNIPAAVRTKRQPWKPSQKGQWITTTMLTEALNAIQNARMSIRGAGK